MDRKDIGSIYDLSKELIFKKKDLIATETETRNSHVIINKEQIIYTKIAK